MKQKRHLNIRQKLMLFTVLLCTVLVAIVWLLNVQLLVPSYNRKIKKELQSTAQVYADLIQQYGTIEDSTSRNGITAEFFDAINTLDNEAILAGKCLDISGANSLNLLHAHFFSDECQLHPNLKGAFGTMRDSSWNNQYIIGLRAMVLQQGNMNFVLENDGKRQMVYCRNVDDRYVVIVSTDLARIEQAAAVVGMQMPMITLLVVLLGIAGAFWFSRWFSRPLSEISAAARSVAKGDYRVRVEKHSNDEIGTLADDFNTMAAEVGRSAELQRDIIANISHDLRTPLTLIKGYAETVRDLTGDDKEKRNAQLDVIVDETDRLSALVNSVMELSKYSSGTDTLVRVHFDLAQLCDEVACRYADTCAKSGVTLETQVDAQCMVSADPDGMMRVVHNLLSNAIHHVGADKRVTLRCVPQENGVVRVEVQDYGAGIAPEDLPHIFDKYYRSRADAGKIGTGLGLSITKAILINHGYDFGVDSEVGKGSTFWFVTK
ncbi:MAG: HAMP domain-containing sensor histidine kinase [Ruthenibacterium sp.]